MIDLIKGINDRSKLTLLWVMSHYLDKLENVFDPLMAPTNFFQDHLSSVAKFGVGLSLTYSTSSHPLP